MYIVLLKSGRTIKVLSEAYKIENGMIWFYRMDRIGENDGICAVFNIKLVEGIYNGKDAMEKR